MRDQEHKSMTDSTAKKPLAQRIRAIQLIRALERHALKGEAMKPTQVTAALALLKKVLPDLASQDADEADASPQEAALRELMSGPA
jgi:hypothetical protein